MILLLLAILISPSAFAISEANYTDVYTKKVLSFYESTQEGQFESPVKPSKKSVLIRYRVYRSPNERGALILLPGRVEAIYKYAEVLYDLRNWGFSLYIMEHRGQGESTRLTKNPQVGYVTHFQDYLDDLDYFITHIVKPKTHQKNFILAHSMGAGIATKYLQETTTHFDGAIFSAPMYGLNTKGYPLWFTKHMAAGSTAIGLGKFYALEEKDRDPHATIDDENLTHSQARFLQNQRDLKEFPELALGGVSWRWLNETLKALKQLINSAGKITTPILIFQARQDKIVTLAPQNLVCSKEPLCRMVQFESARHEILMEKDAIRNKALALSRQFLNSLTEQPSTHPKD